MTTLRATQAQSELTHESHHAERPARAVVVNLERDVLALIAEDRPLAETLDALTLGLERMAAPGAIASVLFVDVERGLLRHASAPHLPAAYKTAIDGAAIGPVAGSCGTAAFRKERVVVSDIEHDPLWVHHRALALPHGLRACWSQPVLSRAGEVLGTLAFYYREPREPSEGEIDAIESASQLVRIVLTRASMEQERERALRREAALHAAARALAEATDVPSALQSVLDGIGRALLWDAGSAWLLGGDERLVCVAQWARDPSRSKPFLDATRDVVLAPGQGLPGRVVASGEPEWIVLDDAAAPSFVRAAAARASDLRAGFALPIVVSGRVLGALDLFRGDAAHSPPDDELMNALATLGLQVGQVIRRIHAQEERERAMRMLQETVRYGELFAGVLGHDLRSPLSAIVMGIDLLMSNAPDERTAATLARMRSSGARMSRMIDQLLDVTRLRAGAGIAVTPCRCDLGELAQNAVHELRLARPNRDVSVTVAGDVLGTWDPDRLAQVLSNLLGNAVAHGDADGPIEVRVIGSANPAADVVRLEVENGGAIDDDVLPHLFDPFRRGRAKSWSTQEGLGLGLYITHAIVVAHGARIDVMSRDRRIAFRVELPRDAVT